MACDKHNSNSRWHILLLSCVGHSPLENRASYTTTVSIFPWQEHNIPSLFEAKEVPHSLRYYTRDVRSIFYHFPQCESVTSDHSSFSPSHIPTVSGGQNTFSPITWVAGNGIHIALHRVALTSSVAIMADYRSRSVCAMIFFQAVE